jgi:hypothetical protein
MKVYGFVGEKRGKSGSVEQILRALNGRLSKAAVNALLPDNADGIASEKASIARLAFTLSLRMMVDAWINSAKTEEGEQPWKRTFWPLFLQDHVERNPPLLQIAEEGPCLVMFPHVWDKRKRLPLLVKEPLESMLTQLEDMKSPSRQFVREIMPFAFDAAIAMFLQLLDSSERTRMFRCDGCRAYFFRARAPKKDTPIYHGSYCANCKGKGKDRARRTMESRTQRTQEKIGWAADAWAQWKPQRRFGERSDWIVKKVNARLPTDQNPIKVNWLTRHRAEIEAELERRKHAKG